MEESFGQLAHKHNYSRDNLDNEIHLYSKNMLVERKSYDTGRVFWADGEFDVITEEQAEELKRKWDTHNGICN